MSKFELELIFHPVTPDRWEDMEQLFGPRGAIGGCWCMWWRIKRVDFEQHQGDGNHEAMCSIVESGKVPGILAYSNGKPVAWCSVAPREDFPVLDRSPILKRVDDQPVWSIVCFFIAKKYRHQGLSSRMLSAAVEYAAGKGARIIEGYPITPKKDQAPDIYIFTGLESTFVKAGFVEVARRSKSRPIMRYSLEK
ncbi:MAG TPA: GNAT family N-acetyltransferase [Anaerolineales bacterium]|jgi:GNAT superfamily N-acetyltransferase|nr:GNAT family N-acetyltransferase [Anaerolineales bacterium]